MKTPRALALLLSVSLLAQSTGAADLALTMSPAARGGAAFAAFPRAAAFPPRAASAPRPSLFASWLADAKTVARWITAPYEPPVAGKRRAFVQPAPTGPVSFLPDAAIELPPDPARDRMLVVREEGYIGAAAETQAAERIASAIGALVDLREKALPRLEGEWIQARGFRFRVNYLDPFGVTRGTAEGFFVQIGPAGCARTKFVREPHGVPLKLQRASPIYYHGGFVRYEVEVEAQEALRAVTVSARQESLSGGKLTDYKDWATLTLKAGERRIVPGYTPLLGQGDGPVNFEQTHVRVLDSDGSTRADVPDAGIVDPPGA